MKVITLKPMQREVACMRHGKPSYRWAPGYIVSHEGKDEYPPVSRNEAYDRARELGATRIVIA